MKTHDRVGSLEISSELRLGANASLVAVNKDGTTSPVLGDTEILGAAKTLKESDSGSVYFLNSATEFAVTLPAPKKGMRFVFIVSAAPSGANYTVVTGNSANIIKGMVLSADLNAASDGDIETSGGDTLSFVDSVAVAGDKVELISDGTNWFAYGMSTAYNAITITTAS